MRKFEREGQGATEYLLMLAAVLVIVAVAVYYVTRAGGYPAVGAVLAIHDNDLVLEVTSGEIPAEDWSVTIDVGPETVCDAQYDNQLLNTPRVVLIEDCAVGTYEVTMTHDPSNHVYWSGAPNGKVTKE